MGINRDWTHPEVLADLATLRHQSPLVHCMTNVVVTGFTANVLLAIGASPAMIIAEEETAEFAAMAHALLINIGTLTQDMARAMLLAVNAANRAGHPWVLDPVAAGVLAFRTRFARQLLEQHPAIIRGNASEILAMSGTQGGGKGVDSTATSHAAIEAAQALSKSSGAVVAVSGATDYVTDGDEVIEVTGGDPIMTRVTGTGCSLGATMAAFLGAGVPPLRAATAASAIYARAGEDAGRQGHGTGSFACAFLDALTAIGAPLPD